MNGRSAALVLASLALLLLPSGTAESFASIQATKATVGDARMDGDLEGSVWLSRESTDPVSLGGREAIDIAGISIAARRAEVTVYHDDQFLVAEDAMEPTRWSLRNVTATGAQADSRDARLVAVPSSPGSARLLLETPSLHVLPGPPGVREHVSFASEGPTMRIDSGASLQVLRGEPQLVRITGAVRLVVDGLDLTLSSDAGTHDLHTRRDVEGQEAQVLRASYAVRSTTHEAVLDLEDAVILLPATESYVRSAAVDANGPWSFDHATGEIGGQPTSPDGAVTINGRLNAAISRGKGSTLDVALTGSPTQMSVDGQALAIEAAPRPWTPGLPAGIAALAAALAIHVLTGRWRFRRLDQAMDRKDFASALRLSRGFRGHPSLGQDAALAAAICLLALGRPADAGGRLAGRRWTVRRRPTRDFLLARAEAALGRRDEASRSLARCLVAEPSLLAQAQADPLLASVLRAARPPAPEDAYA